MPHEGLALRDLVADVLALFERLVPGMDVLVRDCRVGARARVAIGGRVRYPLDRARNRNARLVPHGGVVVIVARGKVNLAEEPAIRLLAALHVPHDDGLAVRMLLALLLTMHQELVGLEGVEARGGDGHRAGPVLAELPRDRGPTAARMHRWERGLRKGCRRSGRGRRRLRAHILRVQDPQVERLVLVAFGDLDILAEVAVLGVGILRVVPHDGLAAGGVDAFFLALAKLHVARKRILSVDGVLGAAAWVAIRGRIRQPPVLARLSHTGLEPHIRGGVRVAIIQLDVLSEPAVRGLAALHVRHDDGLALVLAQAHRLAVGQELVDRHWVEAVLAESLAAVPREAVRGRNRVPSGRNSQRWGRRLRRGGPRRRGRR
mmetsp:Transcript_63827/g.185077  ORF Transcript_63827/g.185077 Transcript_63827/m.185077 type:complete len:375 (-) Transcript_63827:666-1790(-)